MPRRLIGLGVVAILLVGIVGLALWFDWNRAKPFVERTLTAKIGRSVVIAGDLRVTLSWKPWIRAERISIANPDWARGKEMLRAQSIEVRVDLMRLLRRDIYFPEVVLDRPQIDLEQAADGRRNWYLDPEQKEAQRAPQIGRLRFNAAEITFIDIADKTEIHGKASTPLGAQANASVVFDAAGTLLGLPFSAAGSGGPVLALADQSEPYPFTLRAVIGDTKANVSGTARGLATLSDADLSLDLLGDNLAQLYPVFLVALPRTPPYHVTGHLHHAGEYWKFEGFSGKVGRTDIAGDMTVKVGNTRPLVRADIHSNNLDLADVGPALGIEPADRIASDERRVLPEAPVKQHPWTAADMDIELTGKHMEHLGTLPIDDLKVHARLQDGVLTMDPFDFGAAGGTIASIVKLDGQQAPLHAKVSAKVRNLEIKRLVSSAQSADATVGRVGGDIELAATGNSVAELLSNADGRVGLVVSQGTLSKLTLKLASLDLAGAAWVTLTGDSDVAIRCGVANFDVHHGIFQASPLVIDTSEANIIGEGQVNLTDETVDLKLRTLPKKRSILSLRAPLHVTGKLRKLKVEPDKGVIAARAGASVLLGLATPLAALIPLIETAPGKDSDCSGLIASAEQPGTPSVATLKKR